MKKWFKRKSCNKSIYSKEYLENKYSHFVISKTSYSNYNERILKDNKDNINNTNSNLIKQNSQINLNNNLNKESISLDLNEFEQKLNLEKIKLINKFNNEIKRDIDSRAIQIMIEAMERNAESVVSTKFSFTLKLDDDAIKGKIIGRDGRNKKTFENITGTDLIIESDQQAITISSPNPIRREIAKRTMEKLLEIKNIEPNKIESTYEEIKASFDSICYEIGKDAMENKLRFFNLNKELYPIIGRLNFRTSFTQNVLTHSLECAILAGQIAKTLGLDPEKGKKAAFFHDIGKAFDYEFDNDHVNCGVKLAKNFFFEDYVINAIESHHDKVPPNNPYSAIVKVVDKLSASRPGARLLSNDNYFKRIDTIESICKTFKGVKEAYALKSGKQIRVIVNPDLVSDLECKILLHELKFKLEENEIVNKQPIEIIIYREFVVKDKTKGSASRMIPKID